MTPEAESECGRLAALQGLGILDTPPETAFDELATLAAKLCEVPIALVSLVDEHRQWFKAKVGLEASETPREVAFCSHALQRSDVLIVRDALLDGRFSQNPLVVGAPHIRFYAGAPLRLANGHALGTLCVIDQRPRDLTLLQIEALQVLARQVVTQMELRQLNQALEQRIQDRTADLDRANCDLRLSTERYEAAVRGSNDGLWDWNLITHEDYFSERWCELLGYSREELKPHVDTWVAHLHPEEKDWVLSQARAHLEQRVPYDLEFR